jgi:hypothetical protein
MTGRRPTDGATDSLWAEYLLIVTCAFASAAGTVAFGVAPFDDEHRTYFAAIAVKAAVAAPIGLVGTTLIFDAVNRVGATPGTWRHRGISRAVWDRWLPPHMRNMTLDEIPPAGFEDVNGQFPEFQAAFGVMDRNYGPRYSTCLALAIGAWCLGGLRGARGAQNSELASATRAKRIETIQRIGEHIGRGEHQTARDLAKSLGLQRLADMGTMKLTRSPFD